MKKSIAPPIMIVEDDPYIMNSMTEIFQFMGREVIAAENGQEGIEKLKGMPYYKYPSCIILDLMMPHMNGQQFLYQIQALGRVELDCIPIVVSSADHSMKSLSSDRVKYKLQKPIDISHLEEISRTYI